ncbi:hypothetical protein [Nostocoides vanveenii]|uniref:Aromatic ring-opening dioxygenase LigA n=1 Tax=Nostocoides vanveenii TaxID=330835 RepID=A0ABN2K1X7_9MICO
MRSTLDKLISYLGLALAGLLLVGGGLLLWGANFTNSNVHDQLKQQDITMPSGPAIEDPLIKPYLEQYAGQEMTTGDQARAFAEHYIKVHMDKSSGGRTYEDVSGEFITLSKDKNADQTKVAELGQLRQSLFMGNTLRGLLLNAYAFGTMAKIMTYAAVAAFVGAAAMALLALLGLQHAKKVANAAPARAA